MKSLNVNISESQLNLISIGLAIISSIFFSIEKISFTTIAIVVSLIILIISFRSLWSGVLSLFPMLFAINPAPQAVGAPELIFGLMSFWVILGWSIRVFQECQWFFWRSKGFLIFGGIIFFVILNGYVANENNVSLSDWLRGVAPFTYLIFMFPLIYFLREEPKRVYFLGLSVAAYLALLAVHVVGYYIYYDIDVNDRVTLYLSRSTTILMAAGLSMSFVVAVRSEAKMIRVFAVFLSSLSLMAILLTYTRSMLMAALVAILIFFVVLALFERKRLKFAFSTLLVIGIVGIATISYFGLENIWIHRMSVAQQSMLARINNNLDSNSKDVNLDSRLQEIHLAIEHFKESPLLGKGFGIKNVVSYVGKDGPVDTTVAYIHNWLFYFLMIGGIVGAMFYSSLLIWPVIFNLKSIAVEHVSTSVVRYGAMVFIVYGIFFAVFRQIDYNLLLATAIAISIAIKNIKIFVVNA